MEVKSVELRCDDRAELLVFNRYDYEPTYTPDSIERDIDYEINIEDSYCGARCNRFVRAWKAFWGKPIYYSLVGNGLLVWSESVVNIYKKCSYAV